MILKDTIDLMTSENRVDRFAAEYAQTLIRLKNLQKMLDKWDTGTLKFVPESPRLVCQMQAEAMSLYLNALKQRAIDEGINLDHYIEL